MTRPIEQVSEYLKEQLDTIDDDKLISKLIRKNIKDGSVECLNELKTKMFIEWPDGYIV